MERRRSAPLSGGLCDYSTTLLSSLLFAPSPTAQTDTRAAFLTCAPSSFPQLLLCSFSSSAQHSTLPSQLVELCYACPPCPQLWVHDQRPPPRLQTAANRRDKDVRPSDPPTTMLAPSLGGSARTGWSRRPKRPTPPTASVLP